MGITRDIGALEPRTRAAAEQGVAILKAQDIRFVVVETLRTRAIQEAYFAQGRQALPQVNMMREAAGLWPLSLAENQKIITYTLKSKHIDGLALDVTPADRNGNPWWAAPREEWEKIAVVMKSVGFEWGGDWAGAWDKPHYQIKDVV